jgi:uncharacterized protein
MPQRLAKPLSVAAAVAMLAGCGSSRSDPAPVATVRVGGALVRAEVAGDAASRNRGLAGRPALRDGQGMLFVYGDRTPRAFWMKEMRFPIDIVWIDRGRVTGVERDVPVPDSGLPLYRSPGPAGRALEVPAGWAARHGVRPGARVRTANAGT